MSTFLCVCVCVCVWWGVGAAHCWRRPVRRGQWLPCSGTGEHGSPPRLLAAGPRRLCHGLHACAVGGWSSLLAFGTMEVAIGIYATERSDVCLDDFSSKSSRGGRSRPGLWLTELTRTPSAWHGLLPRACCRCVQEVTLTF